LLTLELVFLIIKAQQVLTVPAIATFVVNLLLANFTNG